MSDPVVVSSGKTFECVFAQVCHDLGFASAIDDDGFVPNFSDVILNLALKSTIFSWCDTSGAERPTSSDYNAVEKIVCAKMIDSGTLKPEIRDSERELLKGVAENPPILFSHAATELTRVNHFYSSSSEESVIVSNEPGSPFTPLPLATRPVCYTSSSNSSSEIMEVETLALTLDSNSGNSGPVSSVSEGQEIVAKLKSRMYMNKKP